MDVRSEGRRGGDVKLVVVVLEVDFDELEFDFRLPNPGGGL